jgi:membrane protease YdiL (CAAX protease family)
MGARRRALLYHTSILSILPLVLNALITPIIVISAVSLPEFIRDPVYYIYLYGYFLWPLYHLLLAGVALKFLKAEGEDLKDIIGPFRDKPLFTVLLTVLMLGFSILIFQVIEPIVAELISGPGTWEQVANLFKRIPRALATYSLLVVPLTAGICEELVWRGYLLTRFEILMKGRVWAILLQATLFGLWHASPFLPFSVLVGAVAGYLYVRTRRLLPLMLSHWLGDAIGLAVMYS